MTAFSTIRKSILSRIFMKRLLAAVLLLVGAPFAFATNPVQKANNTRSGLTATSQTLTITLTNPVTSGNAVGVAFAYQAVAGTSSLTSIVDDKGNSYTVDQNAHDSFSGSNVGAAHFLNITNGARILSVTVASTVSTNILIAATIYEVGASTIDANVASSSSFGSGAFNASFTTTAAGEFAIAAMVNSNSTITYTQNNGWTQDFPPDPNTDLFSFSNTLASSGTNSLNATPSAAAGQVWAILSFKSSGGAVTAIAGAASDTTSATGALSATPAPFAPILLDNPAHTNGSDNVGLGSGPGTGTGDTAQVAFNKLKQWAADENVNLAHLFPVRNVQTAVTGFTISAAAGVTQLMLTPAGTLASGTVTLPQAPADNQPFLLMTSQTITALTVNTADGTTISGAPTTQSANTSSKFRFLASANTWYRE